MQEIHLMERIDLNNISYEIIGASYKVHRELGPGLLESTYECFLEYLLLEKDFFVERQKALPIIFMERTLDQGYRIDLLVERQVIVEIKSVDDLAPIHKAQLMTYLKLSGLKLGLLINFNEVNLQCGINRVVM